MNISVYIYPVLTRNFTRHNTRQKEIQKHQKKKMNCRERYCDKVRDVKWIEQRKRDHSQKMKEIRAERKENKICEQK